MKLQSLLICIFLISYQIYSQRSQISETTKQGWTTELNVGLDFVSNLLINPTAGAGQSRFGLGASLGFMTKYNKGKLSWDIDFNTTYGVQKVGTGYLEDNPDKKVPFQKNIDNIWLNSRAAIRTSYFSKFYYTTDLFFSSQLTKTYEDNFLSDIRDRGNPVSKFLSPAILQFALGMDYRPNDYWSLFLSPASLKSIIVLDDEIANDVATDESGTVLGSIHGNPFKINEDGSADFENYDNQFGASIRVVYRNQISKRLAINTNLVLFSNYEREPDHIDINWRNEINVTIFKGLKLSLFSFLTYDHDVFVQVSDAGKPGGVDGLGRRVSYTQQVLLKYSYTFDTNEKR